uniref:Uncharacterized protein n=1 Tax=Chromera velia CCMP2878 TaxID=1169474 RepID=A0A0G4F6K0_9ALVE|eukprot:Cvel_15388.t1-p1 / transcript=Cvel_15388.t1 / gene=Cvel_15388 / organism=Chromera_velia_CCMP2878 / gene_product=hypothetical protein / transcript_product=hypothetical protein / location=Cvel_scaffold1136:2708-14178(+) / protein_length=965 / sequence_SO=supercontig / SO=protein_coding / is_pseudo=false
MCLFFIFGVSVPVLVGTFGVSHRASIPFLRQARQKGEGPLSGGGNLWSAPSAAFGGMSAVGYTRRVRSPGLLRRERGTGRATRLQAEVDTGYTTKTEKGFRDLVAKFREDFIAGKDKNRLDELQEKGMLGYSPEDPEYRESLNYEIPGTLKVNKTLNRPIRHLWRDMDFFEAQKHAHRYALEKESGNFTAVVDEDGRLMHPDDVRFDEYILDVEGEDVKDSMVEIERQMNATVAPSLTPWEKKADLLEQIGNAAEAAVEDAALTLEKEVEVRIQKFGWKKEEAVEWGEEELDKRTREIKNEMQRLADQIEEEFKPFFDPGGPLERNRARIEENKKTLQASLKSKKGRRKGQWASNPELDEIFGAITPQTEFPWNRPLQPPILADGTYYHHHGENAGQLFRMPDVKTPHEARREMLKWMQRSSQTGWWPTEQEIRLMGPEQEELWGQVKERARFNQTAAKLDAEMQRQQREKKGERWRLYTIEDRNYTRKLYSKDETLFDEKLKESAYSFTILEDDPEFEGYFESRHGNSFGLVNAPLDHVWRRIIERRILQLVETIWAAKVYDIHWLPGHRMQIIVKLPSKEEHLRLPKTGWLEPHKLESDFDITMFDFWAIGNQTDDELKWLWDGDKYQPGNHFMLPQLDVDIQLRVGKPFLRCRRDYNAKQYRGRRVIAAVDDPNNLRNGTVHIAGRLLGSPNHWDLHLLPEDFSEQEKAEGVQTNSNQFFLPLRPNGILRIPLAGLHALWLDEPIPPAEAKAYRYFCAIQEQRRRPDFEKVVLPEWEKTMPDPRDFYTNHGHKRALTVEERVAIWVYKRRRRRLIAREFMRENRGRLNSKAALSDLRETVDRLCRYFDWMGEKDEANWESPEVVYADFEEQKRNWFKDLRDPGATLQRNLAKQDRQRRLEQDGEDETEEEQEVDEDDMMGEESEEESERGMRAIEGSSDFEMDSGESDMFYESEAADGGVEY